MISYISCPDCHALLNITGLRLHECKCGWIYEKVLNTKHPAFDDIKENIIQVGYGSHQNG